ncbi:hypothetical protein ACGILS_14040 [Streptomyces albidoflavus]
MTNPVRHEYVLTERGRSPRPVIVALVDSTAGPAASAVMRGGRYEESGRA